MATLLKMDGTTLEVEPDDARKGFQLPQLYRLLECQMIEVVWLGDGTIFVIDEEGKFNEENVVNENATMLALEKNAIFPFDVIVGHALHCKDGEVK